MARNKHRPRGRQILRVQENIMYPWHVARKDKDEGYRESFEAADKCCCDRVGIEAVVSRITEDTGFLSPKRVLPGILLRDITIYYVEGGEQRNGHEDHLWLFGPSYDLLKDHVEEGMTVSLGGTLYLYIRMDGRRNYGFEAKAIVARHKNGEIDL